MKIPVLEFIFTDVADLRPATLLKKKIRVVLSFEFCKIFKNIFFTEYFWTTASGF